MIASFRVIIQVGCTESLTAKKFILAVKKMSCSVK